MPAKRKIYPKNTPSGLLKGFEQSSRIKGLSKNVKLDEFLPAIMPGKRMSKNGKVYYEKRANRSDTNNTKYPFI